MTTRISAVVASVAGALACAMFFCADCNKEHDNATSASQGTSAGNESVATISKLK
jgi:hypothetical protein